MAISKAIIPSIIIGIGIIIGSLIITGAIQSKDEHVLDVSGGKVKLGQVYSENKVITLRTSMSDGKSPLTLLDNESTDDYLSQLRKSVGGIAGDEKKINLDEMSFSIPINVNMSVAMRYKSEFQPLFTLMLKEDDFVVPANEPFLKYVNEKAASLVSSQENTFKKVSFIN
ncbi:Uncharacterised protein [Yersinia rohdei]|uniref:hypothetical protein n=1 Tax=Yersinia rohdei TaxID=29485 RepID=UPI0005E2ED6A|nr:hypothetical protein [Yersinia rohdei]CNJ08418.1 Uncharacterised protein [Yersinia rohdei]